jgi:RNA polymerase sigma-70 factor (ECF subfamily)
MRSHGGPSTQVSGGPSNEVEDRAIDGARERDRDAIHFLYARYADLVVANVYSVVKDEYEAEDITHDVFARLHIVVRSYERRDATFAAWLLRVARNAALDHLRARRQIPTEELRVEDATDEHEDLERLTALREALGELPRDQREVLVLRHVVGLSPTEISTRLARSESSVHGLHHRGRAALKARLHDLGAEPLTLTS